MMTTATGGAVPVWDREGPVTPPPPPAVARPVELAPAPPASRPPQKQPRQPSSTAAPAATAPPPARASPHPPPLPKSAPPTAPAGKARAPSTPTPTTPPAATTAAQDAAFELGERLLASGQARAACQQLQLALAQPLYQADLVRRMRATASLGLALLAAGDHAAAVAAHTAYLEMAELRNEPLVTLAAHGMLANTWFTRFAALRAAMQETAGGGADEAEGGEDGVEDGAEAGDGSDGSDGTDATAAAATAAADEKSDGGDGSRHSPDVEGATPARLRAYLDEARKHYEAQRSMAEELGDKRRIARAFKGLALVEEAAEDPGSAVIYARRYLETIRDTPARREHAQACEMYARFLQAQGVTLKSEFDALLEIVTEQIDLALEASPIDRIMAAKGYLSLARLLYDSGSFTQYHGVAKARECLTKALAQLNTLALNQLGDEGARLAKEAASLRDEIDNGSGCALM